MLIIYLHVSYLYSKQNLSGLSAPLTGLVYKKCKNIEYFFDNKKKSSNKCFSITSL